MLPSCPAALVLVVATMGAFVDARELKFFHISDLHLDFNYSTDGSVANQCHFVDGVPPEKLNVVGNHACDSPYILVESAVRKMSLVNRNPDFILWTGDSNPHWKEGPDFDYIFPTLKNITRLLRRYFDDSVPILPALGNHETNPPDQYPDSTVDKQGAIDFYSKYIEDGAWGDLIPKESHDSFKNCGFYSHKMPEFKLRFLILNTNLYYANKMKLDETDPCGQLAWLQKELDDVGKDEKVFVASHVPPGFYDRKINASHLLFNIPGGDAINDKYVDMFTMKDNSKKVAYHFYGHTHSDHFRLFMDKTGLAAGVAFIGPSVAPSNYATNGTNPSFRIFTYDTESASVLNYDSYYLNLKEMSEAFNSMKSSAESQAGGDRSARNSKFSRKFRGAQTRSKRSEPPAPQEADGDHASEQPAQDQTAGSTDTKERGGDPSDSNTPEADAPSTTDSESQTTENPGSGTADATEPPSAANTTEETNDVGRDAATSSPSPSDPSATESSEQPPAAATTTKTEVTTEGQKELPSTSDVVNALSAKWWKFGYSAKSAFGDVKDLSIKQMHLVYLDMRHDPDGAVFKQYAIHFTMFHVNDYQPVCDATCHRDMMCAIGNLRSSDMAVCLQMDDEEIKVVNNGSAADTPANDDDTKRSTPAPAHPAKLPRAPDADDDDGTLSGVAIGFAIVLVLGLAVAGLFLFRKVQSNRYRSQEFLLTDSIFRYDGYSHVDEP